jgi:DNA-binding response OmpR family regulator
MNVLIVEDDPKLGSLLARGLAEAGHGSHWSGSGEAALEVAETESFDAVVLDLGLPGLDGLEACRRLRDRGFTGAVVVLTARSQLDDRAAGLAAGADDFLLKPFSLDELSERLQAAAARPAGSRPARGATTSEEARARSVDDDESPWPAWLAKWHPAGARSAIALIIVLAAAAAIVAAAH